MAQVDWRLPKIGRSSGESDHAVVESPAPVDDARPVAVRVMEEVEVVSDQLHLVQSLVDGHGLGGVLLLPHDASGQVVIQVPALFGDIWATFVLRLPRR